MISGLADVGSTFSEDQVIMYMDNTDSHRRNGKGMKAGWHRHSRSPHAFSCNATLSFVARDTYIR